MKNERVLSKQWSFSYDPKRSKEQGSRTTTGPDETASHFEELVPDSYCLLCPQLFLFIVSISLRVQFSFYVHSHNQKQEAKILVLHFSLKINVIYPDAFQRGSWGV